MSPHRDTSSYIRVEEYGITVIFLWDIFQQRQQSDIYASNEKAWTPVEKLTYPCRILYSTVRRKHDGNSICRLAFFVVTAPINVNIFDYLLAFNR